MEILRIFRGLMAFLTVIPLKMEDDFLQISARFMFLFPFIGAIIGSLAGFYYVAVHYFLFSLLNIMNNTILSGLLGSNVIFLSRLITSVMTLAFLLVLTGLQHTDGLVDVGNAMGVGVGKKSSEERMHVAHAWIVTRPGALFALAVLFGTLILFNATRLDIILQSLIIVEVSAKLAMVTCGWKGTSPQKGLGASFIESMKNKHKLYTVSLSISIIICGLLLGFAGVLVVGLGILTGFIFIVLGKRLFGGVNGDIFGAANETARMISLIVLVFSTWLL